MSDSEDYADAMDQVSKAIIKRNESRELGRLLKDIQTGSENRINLRDYRLPNKLLQQIARRYRCADYELVVGSGYEDGDSFHFDKQKAPAAAAAEDDDDEDNYEQEEAPQQNWSPEKTPPPPPPARKLNRFRPPRVAGVGELEPPNAPRPAKKPAHADTPALGTKRNLAVAFDKEPSLQALSEQKKKIMSEIQKVQGLLDEAENEEHKKLLEKDKQSLLSNAQKILEQIRNHSGNRSRDDDDGGGDEPQPKKQQKSALKKPKRPQAKESSSIATLANFKFDDEPTSRVSSSSNNNNINDDDEDLVDEE